jgi:enterochelin esterase-like enzyme
VSGLRIGRRGLVLGAAAAAVQACKKSDPKAESTHAYAALNEASAAEPPSTIDGGASPARVVEWSFSSDASEATRAAVVLPASRPGERFPVLVALHGRGEARKGPELGALGWPRDYALVRAIRRLGAPPLTSEDFEGFVEKKRLDLHNARLATAPYRGLVVVCPYLPDLELKSPLALRDYGDFVKSVLLPRVRRELPVVDKAEATGIDGVSLGGAVALRVGLESPQTFGMVGSLQAAIDDPQIPELVEALRLARVARPGLKLRLLTSDKDYFRRVVTATSQAMRSAGLDHEYLLVPGPHDYPFNRGPGALEMLLWHEAGLARS